MFQTNTGWTQNCATLVNLIYVFVKYIFIFLATVNKSNIFECILHIFINSSWIKHSFKKSHLCLLFDCLCIMDFVVLLLTEKVISEFDFKWDGLQRTLNSSEASAYWGKGLCCCLLAGLVPMQKDTIVPPLKFSALIPRQIVWIIQCAFETTVQLRSLSACYFRDVLQSSCTN